MSQTEGHVYNPQMAPKLTNWRNEPSVAKLKEDLEASKPSHDAHLLKVQRWNDLLKVQGSQKPKKVRGRSSVQPKLIQRQAEWRYSALTEPFLSSEKMFDLEPVTFEDQKAADQNELVINWQFRTKINRVKFVDEYVRTNVDEGSAVVRVGWRRLTKKMPETVPVWTYMEPQSEEDVSALEQAIQMKLEDPRSFEEQAPEEVKAAVAYWEETSQPNVAVQTGTEEIETEKIILNHPTLEVINPANVYIDPSCGNDITKAHFVVISFETSQAEMKKEPDRYKNLDFVNWEGASILVTTDHESKTDNQFNFKDALRKRVVAYEYWGFWDVMGDGNLTAIVATWVGDTMVRMEANPFPDEKPPFVVSNYRPIKRELMGEPDAEMLEDNQKILGAITRGMIDLMGRSANGQQGMAKGMLDIVNRRRYESGQDYEFNPNMPVQNSLIEHKYPEIPVSAMNMVALQNQEAEALTGVKSFSGGLSGEAYGDVAAGIRGALDAASKREMSILRRLANGLVEVGKKITAMNAVFLSEEETVRVTNTEFVTVNRDDLVGDFDLKVDISTAEIDNNKAQDLGFMLQTIGNNMDFGIVQIILVEIAKLKRMPFLADQIKNYAPQPDPNVQKMQELELLAKQKEIDKLDSEIQLNIARAQKEANIADQVDLDVTEQETGTKHERDMQKQRGQSQGNQNLEVTKALLKPKKKADGGESDPEIEAAVGFNELSKDTPDRPMTAGMPMGSPPAALAPAGLPENNGYFEPTLDPALSPVMG